MRASVRAGVCAGSLWLAGCAVLTPTPAAPERDFEWRLPPGFPVPPVAAANPMSAAKVELGRWLFYDTRLSGDGAFACASCHRQELAFTDGKATAVGATGESHPRSAMSLANVAYNATYNWADPGLDRLERQALNPLFNRDPIELGVAGRKRTVLGRFRSDPEFRARFREAFPGRRLRLARLVEAIASFERTLISGNSPYDRYLFFGEPLTEDAQRGMELFFSERLGCSACHAGLNLSGPMRTAEASAEPEFHNTGLHDLDGRGAYPVGNRGVFEVTGKAPDMGRFRAPTLRNIAVTAPYLHDGSLQTLDEVVRLYAAGGRGAGRASPLKSEFVSGFSIAAGEERDLIAFLESLTDPEFLTDERFGPPVQD